jgi:hypothetical protein
MLVYSGMKAVKHWILLDLQMTVCALEVCNPIRKIVCIWIISHDKEKIITYLLYFVSGKQEIATFCERAMAQFQTEALL